MFRSSHVLLLVLLVTATAMAANLPLVPMTEAGAKAAQVAGGQLIATGSVLKLTGEPGKPTVVAFIHESGNWDLSAYEGITFSLRNPSDHPIIVRARAENPDAQRLMNGTQNAAELLPGEAKPFVLRLVRRPEDPTFEPFKQWYMYFKDMNVRDNTMDPAQVARITLTIEHWTPGQAVEISGVYATGVGKPLPMPFFPFVDEYGQYVHGDWPGKIYKDSDFAARIKEEERERALWPGPDDRDEFGGWAKGPQLKATGYFYATKHEVKWWLVTPKGHLYWSHGPTGVGPGGDLTPVTDRQNWFVALPDQSGPFGTFYHDGKSAMFKYYVNKDWRGLDIQQLNNYRKYGENYRERVAEVSHDRLRSWGFNSIGNWSDSTVRLMRRTPYTVAIHGPDVRVMKGSDGHSFQDIYDPKWEPGLYANLEKQQGTTANDPWNIGYFVDNERALGWRPRGAALGEMALKAPPDQPAKLKFIDLLKTRYEQIDKFNQAWGTKHISWDALRDSRDAVPFTVDKKDNKAVLDDCGDFGMMFLERYFSVAKAAVKKTAPNNMFLGSRFYGHTDPAVVQLAGKHWDVISYNIYDNPPTGRVDQYNKLDLPIMSTEWGVSSDVMQTPFRDAKLSAPTPGERAALIGKYLDASIRHPNMVGAHFFQFRDQPLSGRPDGEATLRGFVNVADTPNFEMISVNRRFGYSMYKTRFEAK